MPEAISPAKQSAEHTSPDLDRLAAVLSGARRWAVLTGAGCSTESGIPDYRDREGAWKRTPPMQYQEFIGSHAARQRYWARALVGWRHFRHVEPNAAHRVLARFEQQGRLECLITQNVDGLHQRAGSMHVIDLHGRIDTVHCLQCGSETPRDEVQSALAVLNPQWSRLDAIMAPDGDALLPNMDFSDFKLVECGHCGGPLKPAVVFFGERVPAEKVAAAFAAVESAEALLVVGSSLMVFSGYRFARAAHQRRMPIAIVNRGRTRADAEAAIKIEGSCAAVLEALEERVLGAQP